MVVIGILSASIAGNKKNIQQIRGRNFLVLWEQDKEGSITFKEVKGLTGSRLVLSPDPLRDNTRTFFHFFFLSGGTTGALLRTKHFKGKIVECRWQIPIIF